MVRSAAVANSLELKLGKPSAFHDFDKAILKAVAERLSAEDERIFRSQLSLLNQSYEEYDEVDERLNVYYYWRTFLKRSRNDFPDLWPGSDERVLARVAAIYDSRYVYRCELIVVLGRFFAIEISSNAEEPRPISPHFSISGIEVFPGGGSERHGKEKSIEG
jgi:hypothetical protein